MKSKQKTDGVYPYKNYTKNQRISILEAHRYLHYADIRRLRERISDIEQYQRDFERDFNHRGSNPETESPTKDETTEMLQALEAALGYRVRDPDRAYSSRSEWTWQVEYGLVDVQVAYDNYTIKMIKESLIAWADSTPRIDPEHVAELRPFLAADPAPRENAETPPGQSWTDPRLADKDAWITTDDLLRQRDEARFDARSWKVHYEVSGRQCDKLKNRIAELEQEIAELRTRADFGDRYKAILQRAVAEKTLSSGGDGSWGYEAILNRMHDRHWAVYQEEIALRGKEAATLPASAYAGFEDLRPDVLLATDDEEPSNLGPGPRVDDDLTARTRQALSDYRDDQDRPGAFDVDVVDNLARCLGEWSALCSDRLQAGRVVWSDFMPVDQIRFEPIPITAELVETKCYCVTVTEEPEEGA